MIRKSIFLSLFLILVLKTEAQINKEQFNPIDYAIISQTIAPDARAAGMGDIGVATEPDAVSQYWNVAKYPFAISRTGVSVNYTPWLRQLVNDIYLANVSGYYRIGNYAAVSGSINYFSLGEVTFGNGNSGMSVKPYEMAVDLGYSLMLSEKFSIGAAIRYLRSDMSFSQADENVPASTFAADLAMYYQNYINIGYRESQIAFGLNISNIGGKVNYGNDENSRFIPTNLRLGASLMIPIDEYNRFTIAADANKFLIPSMPRQREDEDNEAYQARLRSDYYDISSISGIFKSFSDAPGGFKEELQEISYGIGAEYVYNEKFSLRAGYHHENENKGNRKYFTVGAGFKMSAFSLDAGYVIATSKSNPLDQTLRFTLTFDLDGIKDLFRR